MSATTVEAVQKVGKKWLRGQTPEFLDDRLDALEAADPFMAQLLRVSQQLGGENEARFGLLVHDLMKANATLPRVTAERFEELRTHLDQGEEGVEGMADRLLELTEVVVQENPVLGKFIADSFNYMPPKTALFVICGCLTVYHSLREQLAVDGE